MEEVIKILFKVYLLISIIVLVLFVLHNLSGINRSQHKMKGKEINKENTYKDKAGTILVWMKMMVVSFIPIYHILMLIILLFFSSKIIEKTDKIVEETIKKMENER